MGRKAVGFFVLFSLVLVGLSHPAWSQAPSEKPGKLKNSIGMEFASIPAGKFLMGTPETEKERDPNETRHEVTLTQGFRLGVHEVTQAQYEQVMGKNPSYFKGAMLPVETVSYDDALEFCQKLSDLPAEKAVGRKYRLPTEAEWEYCSRAGTSTPFHFGTEMKGTQANCDGNFPYGTTEKGPYLEKTSPVGSYPANAWGLHDMHGNVWEWCQDWYGDYPHGAIKDPQGGINGGRRVLRGDPGTASPGTAGLAYATGTCLKTATAFAVFGCFCPCNLL